MAEYYAVLKKAIGGLDGNAADSRRAVYDKARNALIGQLKAVDPPLTTAEISRQRLELEEAIRKVEREAAAAATSAPAARPANPPPALPRVEPQPAEMPADGPTPQDVFRRAIQEAEQRGHAAGAIERAAPPPPQQYRADAGYGGATADIRPRERVERAPSPPPPPLPQTLPRDEDYRRTEREYRQPAADYRPEPTDYDDRTRPAAEPRLAPDYNQDWDPPPQPQPPPMPAPQPEPFVDNRDRPVFSKKRKRGYLEEGDRELYEKQARPSRLPTVLLFVLIIAVVGGLGAIAYSQRDWLNAVVADLFSAFESGPATPAPQPAPAPPADVAAASKVPDRLLEGEAPAPGVRVVSPQAPDAPGVPQPEAEPAPEDAAVDTPAPLPVPPATAPATGDALVAQKAILYEEPTDATAAAGGVTAIKAAVTWRFIENGPNGPEIEASLQVPERNMKIRFSIHKNTDASLPASHLIEVVVDTPADFPGGAIQSVPRVVLKMSEEARGEPLIGAQAKITNGFFWIALSAAEQDVAGNLALIRERNWIDLPFVYDTGQRAILTFEKGTPGERVFEKAVAAWGG